MNDIVFPKHLAWAQQYQLKHLYVSSLASKLILAKALLTFTLLISQAFNNFFIVFILLLIANLRSCFHTLFFWSNEFLNIYFFSFFFYEFLCYLKLSLLHDINPIGGIALSIHNLVANIVLLFKRELKFS